MRSLILTGNKHLCPTQADDPFQMLAACMDLRTALTSPHPEAHLSSVAVHQDGSCNGLQHYAALGRDARGGAAVNLAPADRPQASLDISSPGTERSIA